MLRHRGERLVLGNLPFAVVSLLLVLGLFVLGCSSDPVDLTALKPEGDPEVLAIFVTQGSSLLLAYRADQSSLPDWDEQQLEKRGLPVTEEESALTLCNHDRGAEACTGPDDVNCCPAAFPKCSRKVGDDGEPFNFCIGAGQAVPGSPGRTQKIRILVDELLRGSTVEQFVCACHGNEVTNELGMCPNGTSYSLDPSVCDDDPNTVDNETGRFLDVNDDKVPDDAVLLPEIFTVNCSSDRSWVSTEQDGWYNPTGNSFPAVENDVAIWDSLGPALVITPPSLPTNSTCSIAVADSVTDKDGNTISGLPEDVFTTDILRIVSSSPSQNVSGIDITISQVTLTFNAHLSEETLAAGIAITESGNPVPGTWTLGDNVTAIFVPDADQLAPSTVYTVTVSTALTDAFGSPLTEATVYNFTTGAPE